MRDREEATVSSLEVDAVVQVLDEAPVSLGVLYGSHARGDATPNSDVDLAVEFEDSLSSAQLTRARLGLIERLTSELETDDVDVIPLSRAHADLLDEILLDGILIYGSPTDLDRYDARSDEGKDRRNPMAEFDDLLAELKRVV